MTHLLLLQVDVITTALSQLASKGPSIALLVIAVIYFYRRQNKLEADNQALNDKLEKYIAEDRDTMLTALNNNTAAIKEFLDQKVKQ
jgi:hypothetical protein